MYGLWPVPVNTFDEKGAGRINCFQAIEFGHRYFSNLTTTHEVPANTFWREKERILFLTRGHLSCAHQKVKQQRRTREKLKEHCPWREGPEWWITSVIFVLGERQLETLNGCYFFESFGTVLFLSLLRERIYIWKGCSFTTHFHLCKSTCFLFSPFLYIFVFWYSAP